MWSRPYLKVMVVFIQFHIAVKIITVEDEHEKALHDHLGGTLTGLYG